MGSGASGSDCVARPLTWQALAHATSRYLWHRPSDHSRKLQRINNIPRSIKNQLNRPIDGGAGSSEVPSAAGLGARTQLRQRRAGDSQTNFLTGLFAFKCLPLRRSSRPHKHPHPLLPLPALFSAFSASYSRWRSAFANPGLAPHTRRTFTASSEFPSVICERW